MFRILATTLLLAATVAAAQPAPGKATPGQWMKRAQQGKELYATFKTSYGDIVVRLFPKDAPKTVENFVGLASGEKEWTHPTTGKKEKRPLYNGTIFHRVIPDFMIQGGDPAGNGQGHPGFRINDEVQNDLRFDRPGLLAMANAGPNTNGSQFFITTSKPVWLNGRHTIFGEVIQGYEVAVEISHAPVGPMNRPRTPVTLTAVELSDKPPKPAATPTPPAPAPKQ